MTAIFSLISIILSISLETDRDRSVKESHDKLEEYEAGQTSSPLKCEHYYIV